MRLLADVQRATAVTTAVAWDDELWIDSPMGGSAHYVSDNRPEDAPAILVPDGAGGYREHQVVTRARGRLGF